MITPSPPWRWTDQVVTITADEVEITDYEGNPAQGKPFEIKWDAAAAEKGGFDSFMEKEIHDQPAAVRDTLLGRFDEQGQLTLDDLRIDETCLLYTSPSPRDS